MVLVRAVAHGYSQHLVIGKVGGLIPLVSMSMCP